MKTRSPILPALVLAATFGASAASASALISTGNLALDVQSAVGGEGAVSVSVDDGVATLTGNVENHGVADAVIEAASRHESVDEVIDLMSIS